MGITGGGEWSTMIYRAMVAAGSDTVTIAASGESWSGDEFLRRAAGAARLLDEVGALAGFAVPALFNNSPMAQAFLFAGSATDRPLAPLGPRMTVREILAAVEPMAPAVLLAEPASEPLAREVAEAVGARLVVIDELEPSDETVPWHAEPDGVGYVLHTSGTTGRPKYVPTGQRSLAARTRLMVQLYSLTPQSVFAATSPIHHIAGLGLVAVTLAVGATSVCFPDFSIEAWRRLRPLGVTHVGTIATVVEMLMNAGEFALPTLKMVSYGASASKPETIVRMLEENPGVDFITWFGQTEGSPMAYLSPQQHRWALEHDRRVLTTVGQAVPGGEIIIHDPDSNGVGEIWGRAPHMVVTNADGWRESGDLGRIEEGGWLRLVGRKGDMIIRGGENVYPIEVEGVLAEHPSIKEAVVVGIPHERLGETLKAYLQLRPGAAVPAESELHDFVRARLAGFKVPAEWAFVESIPRNQSGKIVRRDIHNAPPL
jgi:acyl-CoA synthetase (AMP-forming)/AMP-acid ligase II